MVAASSALGTARGFKRASPTSTMLRMRLRVLFCLPQAEATENCLRSPNKAPKGCPALDPKTTLPTLGRSCRKGVVLRVNVPAGAVFHTGVYLALICEFVYVWFVSQYEFIWGKFPFSLYATGIYVARNFCGCPACASSADVSVRKCHGTLQGRGLLKSHGLSETPIVWRNTSDTFTPR